MNNLFDFILLAIGIVAVSSREYTTTLNSNCSICMNQTLGPQPNVVYSIGISENKTDSLHIVFSTVTNVPCVQFLYSKDSNEHLTFDYNKLIYHNQLLNNTINPQFRDKILYSFGVCFLNLIEYNDTEDKADPSKVKPDQFTSTPFSTFDWSLAEQTEDSSDYERFKISSRFPPIDKSNQSTALDSPGSFELIYRVSKHEKRERSDELPHLEFTGDSVQLELVLDNLPTRSPRSRFSVELALVSTDKRQSQDDSSKSHMYWEKSLDDEFTPGVFKLFNWCTTNKTDEDSVDDGGIGLDAPQKWTQGIVQWKPIAYTRTVLEPDKTTTNSRGVTHSSPLTDPSIFLSHREVLTNTALYALYGEQLWSTNMSLSAMNLSFGDPKDGFYRDIHTNIGYLSWSFSVGVGQVPPTDHLSWMVMVIVLVCVGLPMLLLVAGFTYLLVRRFLRSREPAGYQVIN
jgi:hypothetical protein